MTLTDDQRGKIVALLQSGLSRDEIAVQAGVSPGTVSAIKAHIARGSYQLSVTSDAETEELIDASETTFGLERDLQKALRANIEQLEPGLSIADDGKEQNTDAGRIDITAKDAHGVTVVIELKAGKAAPEALTQIQAYMGALAPKTSGKVRGILVASDFHPKVLFAARVAAGVQLRQYAFKFTFGAPVFLDTTGSPVAFDAGELTDGGVEA
jgi:hypothetical protein